MVNKEKNGGIKINRRFFCMIKTPLYKNGVFKTKKILL